MLGLLLALGASVSWGVADYLGGVKSRVVPLLTLIAVSQLAGLVLTAAIAGATGSFPDARTAVYAALGGTAGVIAVAAFYRGMAIGRISIVAPVSATGVVLPVAVGLARGEKPGSLALAGIALALVGVILASAEREPGGSPGLAAGVPLALAAAFGFGVFFLFVAKASEHHHALAATFLPDRGVVVDARHALEWRHQRHGPRLDRTDQPDLAGAKAWTASTPNAAIRCHSEVTAWPAARSALTSICRHR